MREQNLVCLRRATVALGTLLAFAAVARADLAEIRQRGTLRLLVILDDDEPEFVSPRAEEPGFDREVLDGFARLQELKVELVPVSDWSALVPQLQQGKGDLIVGRFTATDARRKTIDFTSETFPTRSVVVTRKPHRAVRTLEELREEKITILKGTAMGDQLLELGVPAANIDYSVPAGGIPEALKAGRITCTVHDVSTAIVTHREDPDVQIGVFVGPAMSYAYGVRKDAPELLKALNEYLGHMRRSPSWNRLVVKYFGPAALDVLQSARQ
jgi:polar amino acid transport system substrate-binding protein